MNDYMMAKLCDSNSICCVSDIFLIQIWSRLQADFDMADKAHTDDRRTLVETTLTDVHRGLCKVEAAMSD